MKRVSRTIGLLDVVAKINDLQSQLSFDMALRSALERIVTASRPGFRDWQWRLATLPFAFGGLGVYSAGDVLNYAFIASCLQSAALQTKLLRHVGIVTSGSTFDDALCMFNNAMKIDFLSTPSEVAAPKLMKKMADIYFTWVTKDAESSFSLSPRQLALWKYQREEHTSNWLCVVPISGLGQTMNGILAGKEVDIGLRGDGDKALRPADMYIGYRFLPFSFSSFGELEKDAVTLQKRVRKFSMAQVIGARAAVHNFNRINIEEILGDTTQIDIEEILGDTTQIDIEEILGDTTQIDIEEILGDTTQIDIEEILGDTTQIGKVDIANDSKQPRH
ncbi:hypothetical protein Tco_1057285, partial [Tanacetum coccineum]